jgi:hypothetical protein
LPEEYEVLSAKVSVAVCGISTRSRELSRFPTTFEVCYCALNRRHPFPDLLP